MKISLYIFFSPSCYIYFDCVFLSPRPLKDPATSPKDAVSDLQYSDWFCSNETMINIAVPIKKIIILERVVMSMGMVEEMEVEEEEEDDMDTDGNQSGYQVQSPIVEEGIPMILLFCAI